MALAGTTPPLTWKVAATCELSGPDRPPVPLRVSSRRAGVRAWYVAPDDTPRTPAREAVSNVAVPIEPPLCDVTASPARSVAGMVRPMLALGMAVQVTPSAEVYAVNVLPERATSSQAGAVPAITT